MKKRFNLKKIFSILTLIFILVSTIAFATACSSKEDTIKKSDTVQQVDNSYKVSDEDKAYLTKKFNELTATNKETIAYIYLPGTDLDEPVVQTVDNETYLLKGFDGKNAPFIGTVFMDYENNKNYSDKLTWLFGHARGSKVADHRVFNDVNYFESQKYMDNHKYALIETPSRKYYYEVFATIKVPEDTELYRIEFDNDEEFLNQLKTVKSQAIAINNDIKLDAKDKYLVLSTCREDGDTLRTNVYYRLIPDNEMTEFEKNHKDELKYVAKR